jgi:hypothetical protein
MTITAKYSGQCGGCGRAIEPGQAINWSKGAKSTHVKCGPATAASASDRAATQVRATGACNSWTGRSGACRMRGCTAPATASGLCRSCHFDEYDN